MPTTFTDSISGHDLTLDDPAHWTTPAGDALPNADHATQPNNAAGSYAAYADGAGLFALPWGVSDWTVELWARWTATPDGTVRRIIDRRGTPGPNPAEWQVVQAASLTPELRLRITANDPSLPWAQPAVSFTTGAWYHVVFTVNTSLGSGAVAGRVCNIYKDSVLVSTTSLPSTAVSPPSLTSPLMIVGAPSDPATFIELAKVAIYHRLLTGSEVSDHYLAMTT